VEGEELAGGTVSAQVGAQCSTQVGIADVSSELEGHGERGIILWLSLARSGEVVSTNLVTFSRPKHLELREPGYEIEVAEAGNGAFTVTLCAARPALWVWLELEGSDARYSDNFFHLRPGMSVCIRVTPVESMSRDEFAKRLTVRSLVDTYAM
jgi:beta-mannosidase